MKQKNLLRTLGCAAMMAASGLVACGDDSSSSPEPSSGESVVTDISSSVEPLSSSVVAESSSAMVVSSSLDALSSSSDIINESSSSVENCIHMSEMPPDSDSDPWCDNEGERSVDCLTQDLYICSGHLWERYGDRCVNISDSVSGASDDKSVVIDGQWMYRCDNGKWHVVVPL